MFEWLRKPKIIYYKLFDVKIKGHYIEAKMRRKDFDEVLNQGGEVRIIIENGEEIFYINSPIVPYRVVIVDE